jgi:hypothetical protein
MEPAIAGTMEHRAGPGWVGLVTREAHGDGPGPGQRMISARPYRAAVAVAPRHDPSSSAAVSERRGAPLYWRGEDLLRTWHGRLGGIGAWRRAHGGSDDSCRGGTRPPEDDSA